jgi:chorismate mutase / prephenate dehydratase
MDTSAPPLDHLRAEIDRIDQQILDLLIERSAVVRRIGEVKGDRLDGRPALRPAREAQILRRLAERAGGRFPTAVLVRMWRELVAAHTRLQAPLSVAVFARSEDAQRVWDLARDHFGSATPMIQVDRPMQALRALGDGSATIAVLPQPGDDESWWVSLMSDQEPRLRVFARLPFVAGSGAEGEEVRALAVGQLDLEASGADLTLLAIEAEPGLSRGRLRELLVEAGLEPGWAVAWRAPSPPQALHLVEVDGFVADGDSRIADLGKAALGEILRVLSVGGYARPLSPD